MKTNRVIFKCIKLQILKDNYVQQYYVFSDLDTVMHF